MKPAGNSLEAGVLGEESDLLDFGHLLPEGLPLVGARSWKEGRTDLVLTVSAALHPIENS